MRRAAAVVLALLCLVSCRDKGNQAPADPDLPRESNADVVAIAEAEAAREFGLTQLQRTIKGGVPEHRAAAVRGIGRTVSLTSVAALRSLADFSDEDVLTEVGWAFANHGAAQVADSAAKEIARILGRVKKKRNRAILLRALGRVASKEFTSLLFAALADEDPNIRAAAATAYGLLGRRKVVLSSLEQETLAGLASDPAPGVRYGVAYAFARAHPGVRDPQAENVLRKLAKDGDAETRAVALFGLARRGAQQKEFFLHALNDADWRVRVQAVRGLSNKTSTSTMRAHLSSWLVKEWLAIADLAQRIDSARVHPVLEGLRSLRDVGKERYVKDALGKLYQATDVTESTMRERYTPVLLRNIDAVNCLAAAGLVRAGKPLSLLESCGEKSGAGLPMFARKRLVAVAVGDGFGGSLDARIAKLGQFYQDADARVRTAAAVAALSIRDSRASRIVRQALLVKESVVVGSVVDKMLQNKQVDANVGDLLASRARKARGDPELLLSLVKALRTLKHPRTNALCAAFARNANVTLRQMARNCAKDLTSEDPGLGAAKLAPAKPPYPVADIMGKRITWRVHTSRGVFSVKLLTALAPWNVATLSALAQKGFYDGLLWHRIVADFVVQGGDPDGSGWGGPGFSVPGEPSSELFDRGALGVADAGLDTGGSQLFIMHSRAPHLEGRYTKVGQVVNGMDVVDKLQAFDTIVRIEVVASRAGAP